MILCVVATDTDYWEGQVEIWGSPVPDCWSTSSQGWANMSGPRSNMAIILTTAFCGVT